MVSWNSPSAQVESAFRRKSRVEQFGQRRFATYICLFGVWCGIIRLIRPMLDAVALDFGLFKGFLAYSSITACFEVYLAIEKWTCKRRLQVGHANRFGRRRGPCVNESPRGLFGHMFASGTPVRNRRRKREGRPAGRDSDRNGGNFGRREMGGWARNEDDQSTAPHVVRAPRKHRNRLLDRLTMPDREDHQEFVQGLEDGALEMELDKDKAAREPPAAHRVLAGYEKELFRGISFNWDPENVRYHASRIYRKTGFVPLKFDELSPSTTEELEDLLAWLGIDNNTLQVWGKRMRQWIAANICQKMALRMDNAYNQLASCAHSLGEWGIGVHPLTEVINLENERREEAWIRDRKESLKQDLQRNPNDKPHIRKDYIQALDDWTMLVSLFSGDWCCGLIPGSTPRGYIGMRIDQMAHGTDMQAYEWDGPRFGHGDWAQEDLPSDTHIILMMFAGYLIAPGWNFGVMKETPPESSGGPLLIAQLPKYQPDTYSAILRLPPKTASKGAKAIIIRKRQCLNRSEPVLTLMMGGKLAVNFSSSRGIFHALAVFLHYHRIHNDSRINGYSLSIMDGMNDVFGNVREARVVPPMGKRDFFAPLDKKVMKYYY